MNPRPLLSIKQSNALKIIEGARDRSRIEGLTHDFYRYPARFSPQLVRALISELSEPGDWVFDPFMGGGTTLVESLALQRNAIGTDISSLATFVAEVKTTVYDDHELDAALRWSKRAAKSIDMHAHHREVAAELQYQRNLRGVATWRIRKAISQCLTSAARLKSPRIENLARCIVLRTAQWSMDGRRTHPSVEDFRLRLRNNAELMCAGAKSLRDAATPPSKGRRSTVRCLNRPVAGIHEEPILKGSRRPRLILTSPPYPGVHVLYHRWQVNGRKETPAPFWIAKRADGSGASYYTMGDRKSIELLSYFDQLRAALTSVAGLCDSDTTVVQVVAFSQPNWQLSRYLSVADDAGLKEHFLPELGKQSDGRLWRSVPNRKWHAEQKGATSGSMEVVLFHKLA